MFLCDYMRIVKRRRNIMKKKRQILPEGTVCFHGWVLISPERVHGGLHHSRCVVVTDGQFKTPY